MPHQKKHSKYPKQSHHDLRPEHIIDTIVEAKNFRELRKICLTKTAQNFFAANPEELEFIPEKTKEILLKQGLPPDPQASQSTPATTPEEIEKLGL